MEFIKKVLNISGTSYVCIPKTLVDYMNLKQNAELQIQDSIDDNGEIILKIKQVTHENRDSNTTKG